MQRETLIAASTIDREISATRVFNAPRELVFTVWTDPKHIVHRWGPRGFTNTIHTMDVRPSGLWLLTMHGPDGTDYPNKVVYREVIKPERLVYDHGEEGEPAYHHGTVTFEDLGGRTKVTMQMLFETADARNEVADKYHAVEGLSQNFDKLGEYLSNMEHTKGRSSTNDELLIIERTYNAPNARVWKAITDGDDMRKWYFDIAMFKPEVGFEFQFLAGNEEKKWRHLCRVSEVIPGRKLTYTWRYDGYPGISFVTFELFQEGSQTRLKLTHKGIETFPSTDPAFARESFTEGWNHIIGKALKEYVEPAIV